MSADMVVSILTHGKDSEREIATEKSPKRTYKKRKNNPAKKKKPGRRYDPKPCCGSMGPRHKVECPESGKSAAAQSIQRDSRHARIMAFIEEGGDDESIAEKVGVSVKVVKFYRNRAKEAQE